jgi:P27 family predicted phage terminase small subunit
LKFIGDNPLASLAISTPYSGGQLNTKKWSVRPISTDIGGYEMSRKKPLWKRKLEGSVGKRHPFSPPGVPVLRPMEWKDPPDWLGEHGKRFWNAMGPELIDCGLLTELDGPAFEMLCATYDRGRSTQEILEKEGLVTKDERGLLRKHPLWQIHRESTNLFFSMCHEFGLQPTGRAKLDIKVLDPDDKKYGIAKYIT